MGVGKLGLYAYKKFVSPHLNATCNHEVSCSQYAREAVEQQGLWEGSKRAFMRVNSCQDSPGGLPHHHHADSQHLVLHPPQAQAKSTVRKKAEGFLFQAAAQTGRLVGGTLAAVLGAPVAAVLGGLWGAKAGAGTLKEYNEGLRAKYGAQQTHSLERLQSNLTGAGTAMRERFGKVAGAVTGAAAGAALGLVGGAVWCFDYFGGMAGLGLQNGAKSYLGELPVHYRTEQILRADYAG
jgi:putative component of membrane protein insertase Oxa1/YidC/SpoIIIJ protein YidD